MTLTGQERHCSTSVPFDLGLGLTWLKTRLRLPTARLPASINAARCDTGLTSLCPCEMSSSYHQINPNQFSARCQQHSTTTTTTTVTCATAHTALHATSCAQQINSFDSFQYQHAAKITVYPCRGRSRSQATR